MPNRIKKRKGLQLGPDSKTMTHKEEMMMMIKKKKLDLFISLELN